MDPVAPYVPDANYGGTGGPGFDYDYWKPESQKQPTVGPGVNQHAFNADQTNGIGYQLKNSDQDAYKNFTAYGTAIGSGMDEESAKRHAYDANGYANYNYDGSQRGASSVGSTPVSPQAEAAPAAPPPAAIQPFRANGQSPAPSWSPPAPQTVPEGPVRPLRGIGGTNSGIASTGYGTRSQAGISNTFRGRAVSRGF